MITNLFSLTKVKNKDIKHTRKHLGSSVCLSVSVSIGQSMSVFVCFFQSNVIFEQSNNITFDSQRAFLCEHVTFVHGVCDGDGR